ncbi:MAG: zinc ribbon domain-containing protein [Candidatus Nitrosotenuis sp.]
MSSNRLPEEHQTMFCPRCKKSVDRDVNAARNILAIGLAGGTKVVPDGAANEAMVEEPHTGVILKVDAAQLACRLKNSWQVYRT